MPNEDMPPPTPEGELIRTAREAHIPRLSIREAARRVGLSFEIWGATERGYQSLGRGKPVRKADSSHVTVAQMAFAVGVSPEELAETGRADAAATLREIIRRQPPPRPRPTLDEITEYLHDQEVPIAERQRFAARFLEVLPYLMRGEEPPAPADESRKKIG